MKHLLTLLAALLLGLPAAAQRGTFRNPVIPGDLPDPTLLRVGDRYFASGTSSEWAPLYPLFESSDLVNWRPVGHLLAEPPAWTRSSFWAPELFCRDGRYYVYYTARRRSDGVSCIGVATADRPEGPYTDRGPVVEYGSEAIDAFVFEDDGALYISWKAYGLEQRPIELLAARLTDDGLRLAGEPFMLLRDDERRGMEGQHWLRRGDWYYLIYAANGCCGPDSDYTVEVARSRSLRGPYEKYAGNPILRGGNDRIQSCGHGTVAETPDGRMYLLCHAYLRGAGFFAGRQPVLQELYVDEQGWIRAREGRDMDLVRPVPFSGTVQLPVAEFYDDFSSDALRPEWSWNYPYATPEILLADGRLLLSGTPCPGVATGTALCLRPVAADYEVRTALTAATGARCGLTFYGDDRNLLFWGRTPEGLALLRIGGGSSEALLDPVAYSTDAPLHLRMEVRAGAPAAFSYSPDGRTWTVIPSPRPVGELLQWDRVARPGLYFEGAPEQCLEAAYFLMR